MSADVDEVAVVSVETALMARLVQAELRTEALRAGMVDLDGVKLMDTSAVVLGADGIEGGAALMAKMREAKPWLFGRPAGRQQQQRWAGAGGGAGEGEDGDGDDGGGVAGGAGGVAAAAVGAWLALCAIESAWREWAAAGMTGAGAQVR